MKIQYDIAHYQRLLIDSMRVQIPRMPSSTAWRAAHAERRAREGGRGQGIIPNGCASVQQNSSWENGDPNTAHDSILGSSRAAAMFGEISQRAHKKRACLISLPENIIRYADRFKIMVCRHW
jgi:hypothetical protein